jgi:uncharacterized protein (TIGR02246 family)
MSSQADVEKDREAIDAVHERDMMASKAGDYETLRSLWTDDAVIMPPGGNFVRGRAALDASLSRMKEAMSQIEVLEYVEEFEEVMILGDYAFEWGIIRGAERSKEGGEVAHSSYKVMRILQKQPNGEWKIHRSIWNANLAQSSQE